MTIILTPEQEQAVRDAIHAGQLASVEDFIERALAELPKVARAGRSAQPTKAFLTRG